MQAPPFWMNAMTEDPDRDQELELRILHYLRDHQYGRFYEKIAEDLQSSPASILGALKELERSRKVKMVMPSSWGLVI